MREKIRWRELDIDEFLEVDFEDFKKTPDKILKIIYTLGLPIRVIEGRLLKVEKGGSLRKIEKKGDSVELTLHGINPEPNKKGKDHVVIITEENGVSVGLPTFA